MFIKEAERNSLGYNTNIFKGVTTETYKYCR